MFQPCECGSGKTYAGCCGRLHLGAPARDAEELMRSRYCAFHRGDAAYLRKSWAAETRPADLTLDPAQAWTGLTVHSHETTGPATARVRFTATWRKGARTGRLTETSRFRREGPGWVYVDGEVS
ncbi:YchJ family metal-binding protein [Albimonas sp. CAU 1670]|uniref:YchJ family protein n=1 Tax=Albimonas sp. CAU 1670 TaxID=3032599 RepID=UPI0023D9E213|nr:YchJ family metal-binding protein [Albimonas sp. CAU 1670]MDF2235327.1 YchJ family metal-binding protein [Albimonas sp. CAU 1670]